MKRSTNLLAAIVLASCLGAGSAPAEAQAAPSADTRSEPSSRLPAKARIEAARAALAKGELDDAERLIDGVGPGDGDVDDLDFLRASIAYVRGDWDAAIARYRAMLDRNPDLPRVRLDLARTYFDSGRNAQAAHHFQQALDAGGLPPVVRDRALAFLDEIRRRTSARRMDAARAAIAKGELDDAEFLLDGVRPEEGTVDALDYLRASIAYARGDRDAAIARFRAILDRNPHLPRVRLDLARTYFDSGRNAQAAHHFQLALEAEGLPPVVRDRALDFLDRIRRRTSTPRIDAAYAALAKGELNDAELLLDGVGPGEGDVDDLDFLHASIAYARGDRDTAIARYSAIVDRNPDLPRARLDLARTYFDSGQDTQAAHHFRQALDAGGLPPAVRERALDFLDQIRRRTSARRAEPSGLATRVLVLLLFLVLLPLLGLGWARSPHRERLHGIVDPAGKRLGRLFVSRA